MARPDISNFRQSTQVELAGKINRCFMRSGHQLHPLVLRSLQRVDRADFIPDGLEEVSMWSAHKNRVISLDYLASGSSMSQPSLVAQMIDVLQIPDAFKKKKVSVLEIGTGSGYNAALISSMSKKIHVDTVDIHDNIVDHARSKLGGYKNVTVYKGDRNTIGIPGKKFDFIIVTASVSEIPPSLIIDQLEVGGRMIIPVSVDQIAPGFEELQLVEKLSESNFRIQKLGYVSFLPVISTDRGGWLPTFGDRFLPSRRQQA